MRELRGTVVALLSPPSLGRSARDRLVAAGRLFPASAPTGSLLTGRPVPATSGPSNQDLLYAGREERL